MAPHATGIAGRPAGAEPLAVAGPITKSSPLPLSDGRPVLVGPRRPAPPAVPPAPGGLP